MKERKDFSKVIADISILFELSLAVGQSLNLQTNCDRFIKTLMARKNLGYSSVWIKGEYLVNLPEEILLEDRDENSAFLVYANPEFRIKEKSIPPHHLIFSMLEGKEAFSIASTEDRFSEIITEKGIDKGIFAIFSLGKLGFLKLFSMMRETPFGEEELNQLNNVVSKFTISLEGCIAHQKVVREITERKQAEEALRESEQKYRSLVNNIKLGIFRSAPEPSGKFIEVNLAMEEITGYSREELLSMNVSDLYMRPEERETVVAEVATATGKTTKELNFRKKDGAEMVVSDTKIAVRDNTGKVLYFDGIIEDITERKRTEEALKQSEETALRLARETATIAEIGRIISSTLDIEEVYELFAKEAQKLIPFDRISVGLLDPPKDTITVVHIAGVGVEGLGVGNIYPLHDSASEIVMQTHSSLIIHPECKEDLESRFPRFLPHFQAGLRSMMLVPLISGDNVIGILHLQSKKQKAYTDQDRTLAENIAAQIAGAIANAQLFLEQRRKEEALSKAHAGLKQAQAQLIQAEKAEVIGRLASGVAHEVKNPLAIIVQGIDYLSANVPLDKANVSLTLKHIMDAVKKADNITKGLLSFSRAEEIEKMPENLNSIIENCLLFVKNILDKYHVEIIKELGKDIPSLNLDKSRIEQVFLNLFLNAIDAMPGGGQLKVKTYNKTLTGVQGEIFKPGEKAVTAEIEDTGTGIPADIMDKIFDPFFTTKRDKGGTGLGLPIVRNIVETHNGEIKIENITDRSGVRVTIRFK